MRALWMRSRFRLRRGWRATGALVFVVGIAGSLVLAALAGAARSETALTEFLRHSQPANVLVVLYRDNLGDVTAPPFTFPARPDELLGALGKIRTLSEVASAYRGTDIVIGLPDRTSPTGYRQHFAHIHFDAGGDRAFGRGLIVDGRLAHDEDPDEILIDEEFARLHDLHVGSTYRAAAYGPEQAADLLAFKPVVPAHPARDLRVVGIVRRVRDLLPAITDQTASYVVEDEVYLTPAYYDAHAGEIPLPGVFTAVRLRDRPGEMKRLTADVTRLFGPTAEVLPFRSTGGNLGVEEKRSLEHAVSYETDGLRIFALLVAISAVVFVGQAFVRLNASEGKDDYVFRALGMTRGQLFLSNILRSLPIALGSAVVAVAVAITLSPIAPIGAARRAVLHRGVAVDYGVLLPGAAAISVVVLALAALAASWHVRPRRGRAVRRVGIFARLSGAGAPPPAALGTGFALSPGRGAAGVPSRSAIVAATTAIVGLLTAGIVLASYQGLVDNPDRFGVAWDVQVGLFQFPRHAAAAESMLARDPDIAGFAGVRAQDLLVIDGHEISAMALEPAGASAGVPVEVLSGRVPANQDEISLGSVTMRRLDLSVGDSVEVTGGEAPAATMRVVGNVVMPAGGVDYELGPGKGALVTTGVLDARYPAVAFSQSFVIDLVKGVDPVRKAAELEKSFPDTVLVAPLPAEVRNLRQVRELPVALAAVVAVLAIVALVHTLTAVTRRRRRDLAILKTIGFTRRQLSSTVAWQSTVISATGIVIGVPLGVIAGRGLWRFVATQLGVVPRPVVPPVLVVIVGAGALVVANLVAVIPGWLAGRTPAALVLRNE